MNVQGAFDPTTLVSRYRCYILNMYASLFFFVNWFLMQSCVTPTQSQLSQLSLSSPGRGPMIGLKGKLNVIDNTGALIAECVNVLKHKVNDGFATVGDEIVVVINNARPTTATLASGAIKVRKGDIRRAVVVRTRKPVRRPDGHYVRFDDNAAVLLNNKREMLGTRIGGVVSADLRMRGWTKILSLAPKVV